jgi:hypothetical protein
MARFIIALFALIGAILTLAARRGTLHDLEIVNESLRQGTDSLPQPVAPRPEQSSADADQLNPDERAELLRLRGQILPLQQEIRDISNRIERATALSSADQIRILQTNTQTAEMAQKQRAQSQAAQAFFQSEPVHTLYRNAAALGQKLQKYLRENNGQLPQDLSILDGAPDGFELMRSGSLRQEEEEGALVARQKNPVQTPDGKWVRLYVRADGAAVAAARPTNDNWTSWEQRSSERAKGRLPAKPQ